MSSSTEQLAAEWRLTRRSSASGPPRSVRGPSSVTGTMPGGAAMMSGIRLNRLPAVASAESRRSTRMRFRGVPSHLPGHVLDVAGQEHALLDRGRGDDALRRS